MFKITQIAVHVKTERLRKEVNDKLIVPLQKTSKRSVTWMIFFRKANA